MLVPAPPACSVFDLYTLYCPTVVNVNELNTPNPPVVMFVKFASALLNII